MGFSEAFHYDLDSFQSLPIANTADRGRRIDKRLNRERELPLVGSGIRILRGYYVELNQQQTMLQGRRTWGNVGCTGFHRIVSRGGAPLLVKGVPEGGPQRSGHSKSESGSLLLTIGCPETQPS